MSATILPTVPPTRAAKFGKLISRFREFMNRSLKPRDCNRCRVLDAGAVAFEERCISMSSKSCAALLVTGLALGIAVPAAGADLPGIKVSESNRVPECATPGRLMAFLKSRNRQLGPSLDSVATEYMRHGEALELRWDYAFFQMMLETGNLTYKGDVRAEQNNFAGLGATGGGVRGESFKDVSTGVRAHLEHVLLYSGARVENPVAERTRKVQDWNLIQSWYKDVKGPLTFAHLAKRWAPGSGAYPKDIAAIAEDFQEGPCRGDDPQPQLVAEARGGRAVETAGGVKVKERPVETEEPAATADMSSERMDNAAPAEDAPSGLGGKDGAKVTALDSTPPETPAELAPGAAPATVTVLNAAKPEGSESSSPPAAGADKGAIQTAAAAGPAQQAGASTGAAPARPACKVWTASYGGQKAIIIKATTDSTTNYTVLDVNEGREKREAEAYIAAYAKGGEMLGGEFPSQANALDKAFELCPEG